MDSSQRRVLESSRLTAAKYQLGRTLLDRESIVSTVQSLLREGASTKDVHADLTSREAAHFWKAQDFLAKKAIEEAQDDELEKRFSELVPRNAVLVDKLNQELTWIQSPDLALRLQAAKSIDKEVLGVLTSERSLWLRHPETVAALREALKKEDDPSIQEMLVRSLGGIYERSLKDPRIFSSIEPFYGSESPRVLFACVAWTSEMSDLRKWHYLIPMAQSCGNRKLMEALTRHLRLAPRREKELLIAATLQFISAKKLSSDHAADLAMQVIHAAEDDTADFLLTHLESSRDAYVVHALKVAFKYCDTHVALRSRLERLSTVNGEEGGYLIG